MSTNSSWDSSKKLVEFLKNIRIISGTHLDLAIIVEGLQLRAHQLEEHAPLLVELLLQAGHIDLDEERLGQPGLGGGDAPQCIQHTLVDGRGHFEFPFARKLFVFVFVIECAICIAIEYLCECVPFGGRVWVVVDVDVSVCAVDWLVYLTWPKSSSIVALVAVFPESAPSSPHFWHMFKSTRYLCVNVLVSGYLVWMYLCISSVSICGRTQSADPHGSCA